MVESENKLSMIRIIDIIELHDSIEDLDVIYKEIVDILYGENRGLYSKFEIHVISDAMDNQYKKIENGKK